MLQIATDDYTDACNRAWNCSFGWGEDEVDAAYERIAFQEILRSELILLREECSKGEFIPEDGKYLSGGQKDKAAEWLEFCVRKLREAKHLSRGMSWGREIVPGCTVEELMGAILAGFEQVVSLQGELDELREAEGAS